MIKPASLYAFGKKCKNDRLAGRILRKLCGQDVALTEAETVMYEMIEQDGNWMDERVEEKRAKERERKRRYREGLKDADAVEDDSQCPTGQNGKTLVTHHSSIRPSVPPSVPPKNKYTVPLVVPLEGQTKTTNENGVDFNIKKEVDACKRDIANDEGVIFEGKYSPTQLAIAITGDSKSARRWAQLAKDKGEAQCLEEMFTFVRELKSGEEPSNRGACLNARLTKLPNSK